MRRPGDLLEQGRNARYALHGWVAVVTKSCHRDALMIVTKTLSGKTELFESSGDSLVDRDLVRVWKQK